MNIVGHRGASGVEPENTPQAFATADRMGADGVELDVRIAPDGHGSHRLVIFHNPLPDDQEFIDALPSLDEVLDACGERMLVNVEIKNNEGEGGFDPTMAVVEPTIDTMRRRGAGWADRWLISSFSAATVAHCRRVAPEIPTAYLVMEVDDAAIAEAVEHGHQAIHPWHVPLTGEQVDACHEAGLTVNIWTCNDDDRLQELAAMGVDGVCTDVPDTALVATGRGGEVPNESPSWLPR